MASAHACQPAIPKNSKLEIPLSTNQQFDGAKSDVEHADGVGVDIPVTRKTPYVSNTVRYNVSH